jgi:hypothetical protein
MRFVFYNHYHNGDIFASKGYIEDLIKELSGHEVYYQHFNSQKLLKDLNIEFRSLESPISPDMKDSFARKIFQNRDTVYINTWIGNSNPGKNGVNWNNYHSMFGDIYNSLSDVLDRTISLAPKEYYIPNIYYEYFDIPDIDIPNDSIIISNGPVMSGQSDIPDLNSLIDTILSNTDRNIFLTHFAPFNSNRITYTNNIISTTGGDLNEISWIASNCEYVIGRNSGPFCFMHTKNILNNKNKKIISIGNKEKDSFLYNFHIDAEYHFIDDSNITDILDIVK